MKWKNRIKIALDLIMLTVLALMYSKNAISMTFHEVGGIAVCGLFIIHILLNGKWVLAVSGKLFSKKYPLRAKINWIIDFLLLLCFGYILFSGIQISKVVFSTGSHGSSNFKMGHYGISALALALIGIHVGMHVSFISRRFWLHKLPLLLRRIGAVVLSVMILGFGVYQMTDTSFLQWMSNVGTTFGLSSSEFGEGGGSAPQGGDFSSDMTMPSDAETGFADASDDGSAADTTVTDDTAETDDIAATGEDRADDATVSENTETAGETAAADEAATDETASDTAEDADDAAADESIASDTATADAAVDETAMDAAAADDGTATDDAAAMDGSASFGDEDSSYGERSFDGNGNGDTNGFGGEGGGHGGGQGSVSVSNVLTVLLNFVSIALAFGVISAWIDGIICYRKKCKRRDSIDGKDEAEDAEA